MPKINFFTPVHYGPLAKIAEQKAIQDIDDYFHICGKKAVVLSQDEEGFERVILISAKISPVTVLKTIGVALSFLTVVIPVALLIAKAALRSSHKYIYEISNYKTPELQLNQKDPPDKPRDKMEKQQLSANKTRDLLENKPKSLAGTKATGQTPKDLAATVFQKNIRGFLARKPLLSSDLYPKYNAECVTATGPDSDLIPQAPEGKTRVYLPKAMPEVVLKKSGREKAIERFHQMQEVRSILEAQRSSHLIIPKANLCQEFLVEERLPINADDFHNMGLYLSHPELFDEAVREMVRLFSKIYLSDLLGGKHDFLGRIEGVGEGVRYDNLPLFIEEENGKRVGKIGLIDLESLNNEPSYRGLATLARIFPTHLSIIKEEAEKLKMTIDHKYLDYAAKRGKIYLQVGYTDHLNWLKDKGITSQAVNKIVQISPERVLELNKVVKTELLLLNQGVNDLYNRKKYKDYKPPKGFIKGDIEPVANELSAQIVPLILSNIQSSLQEKLAQKLASQPALSESSLVSQRSAAVERSDLHKDVEYRILQSEGIVFTPIPDLEDSASSEYRTFMDRQYAREIAEQLAHILMKELVRGGDIFQYYPGEYCWICF